MSTNRTTVATTAAATATATTAAAATAVASTTTTATTTATTSTASAPLTTTTRQEKQTRQQRQHEHGAGAVRHLEKRRTGTCQFANRIAQVSLAAYRQHVPHSPCTTTCVAAIVAHFTDGRLQVLGLGVGTKFLSESLLRDEETTAASYGRRVRDCHAEVLARRAFRRQLSLEVLYQTLSETSSHHRCILQRRHPTAGFQLDPQVTLHLYTSSAPCGNATLKKFLTLEKEQYLTHLGPQELPQNQLPHEPLAAHSLHLGQFALLCKKDATAPIRRCENDNDKDSRKKASTTEKGPNDKKKGTFAQARNTKTNKRRLPETDDWCPPGTSHLQGSLHSCSDKICRWNFLGLQGSLLYSLLDDGKPLYMTTVTVGRKFSNATCRRALCCRAEAYRGGYARRSGKTRDAAPNAAAAATTEDLPKQQQVVAVAKETALRAYAVEEATVSEDSPSFIWNHPIIMGTGVYMSEDGVIDMSGIRGVGKDVSFLSSHCWVWCPGDQELVVESTQVDLLKAANEETKALPITAVGTDTAECIDGSTGFVVDNGSSQSGISRVSTATLNAMYAMICCKLQDSTKPNDSHEETELGNDKPPVQALRQWKQQQSPDYEMAKEELLTTHSLFQSWIRRGEASP